MADRSAVMTLPGKYYTDPDIFRREVERFFAQGWVCVGRTSQLAGPGDYFLADVAGESIIVVRDADLGIRAWYNVCRHRGTRMCTAEESSFPGRIRCPYHGWTYALDGSLIGAPHMELSGFRREDYPLHAAAASEWEGHVFVALHPQPQSAGDLLAPLRSKFAAWRMDTLQRHKRIMYDVRANWKLIVLNYNECLHCPVLHPALNRLTDYLGADNEAPTKWWIGGSMGFRGDAETMSIDGVRRREYLPGLGEAERRIVAYYAIFPNLLLSLHPDYMMTHLIWPKAPDRTEIVCEWHFHPDEMAKPGFEAEDAIRFWDMTNREDWAVSELSQAGISSRAYRPGPYSPRESLLHAFDKLILEADQDPV